MKHLRFSGVSGIYRATHRETGRCYVGSSSNIGRRISCHLSLCKKRKTCFHSALHRYGADAFDFTVVEECPRADLLAREKHYINEFSSMSPYGWNYQSEPQANFSGRKHTPESRAKMCASHAGTVLSEEHKRKIGLAHKGRPKTESQKQKIREANLGKKVSEETRRKMSIAKKGMKCSIDACAKISASKKAYWVKWRANRATLH